MRTLYISVFLTVCLVVLLFSGAIIIRKSFVEKSNVETATETDENASILNLEFSNCKVFVHLVSGNTYEVGNTSGPNKYNLFCDQNNEVFISPSGKYAAYKGIVGGLDSAIWIYSLENNKITTLDVFGTSTIMSVAFMPKDILLVLSGYPDVKDEQWLRAYNIPGLYVDYNRHIIFNSDENLTDVFALRTTDTKDIQLPYIGMNYKYFLVSTESVVIHTDNAHKFTVIDSHQYRF